MSGISAGKTLHNGGYTNFIILEARDKVGGRLKAVDFAGVKVEVGANWIHVVDPTGTKSESMGCDLCHNYRTLRRQNTAFSIMVRGVVSYTVYPCFRIFMCFAHHARHLNYPIYTFP